MRRFLYAGAALLTAAALVAGPGGTAYAAPPVNGTTVVTGTPTAGVPLAVQVTLYGVYPIVPYDFSLENRCWFGGRFAGPADSSETYPLLGPWYAADRPRAARRSTSTTSSRGRSARRASPEAPRP